MIKNQQIRYKRKIIKHNQGNIWKSTANFVLNGEILGTFPLRSRTWQECPLSQLLSNIVLKVLARAIRQWKEIRDKNWKGGNQVFPVYRSYDSLSRELKHSPKRLLKLMGESSEVSGYEVRAQQLIMFRYRNNSLAEKEFLRSISLIRASNKIKYVGIHLANDIRDLCDKNHKTLKK